MNDLKISELHAAALKEFADDPEAIRRLNELYDQIRRDFIAEWEQLKADRKLSL